MKLASKKKREWYDYSVYGFFAPIIASQFSPFEDRVASLLATFAVFAVAFFMRPVGAFVFGHFGDTVGRRNTLAAAVVPRALPWRVADGRQISEQPKARDGGTPLLPEQTP